MPASVPAFRSTGSPSAICSFLGYRQALPFIVVHGHSPVKAPERHDYRIAVDTGCYATGILSAVRLDGAGITFL